ncbi:hypothetical protein [Gemmatimonas sp.]
MGIPTHAQTVELYVPKFDRVVAINLADEAFYRAEYGARSPAEQAAQQAAPKTGKPFKSKAEKDAEKDAEPGDTGSTTTTP